MDPLAKYSPPAPTRWYGISLLVGAVILPAWGVFRAMLHEPPQMELRLAVAAIWVGCYFALRLKTLKGREGLVVAGAVQALMFVYFKVATAAQFAPSFLIGVIALQASFNATWTSPGASVAFNLLYLAESAYFLRGIPPTLYIKTLLGLTTVFLSFFFQLLLRKRVETEQASQRARIETMARLASVGEMAAGIAHELNNPLAIIAGRTLQLRRLLANDEPFARSAEGCLTSLDATTNRISRIINGLLTLSRDTRDEPHENLPISEIVNDALSLCGEKFRARGVELRVEIAPETLTAYCRPTQISLVVLNLLANAFDAIGDRTEKQITIRARAKADRVEIRVTDNGCGVPDAIREKIFQPFFTTKDPGKGTGLGLSLSRQIVENHRGSIALEPDPGQTTFVLTLPAAGAAVVRENAA